tara:strand:+ start:2257 stop:3324 length:1068 start_codon:yes stop_codon:yes gene_type:complete
MTANAMSRSVRSITRKIDRGDKLNILTFPTHERYEENLCKTGHNFYSINYGKHWDNTYASVPENYHIINSLPEGVDFDLVLSHTSCDRIPVAVNLICKANSIDKMPIPILRHCHILPNPNLDIDMSTQSAQYKSVPVTRDSFISKFNLEQWGFVEGEASIVEHGVDTDFWKPDDTIQRDNVCLSVVNDWPNRDWCCGFGLWASSVGLKTEHQLPVRVYGNSPGFSDPADDTNHLRQIYSSSRIFYNTSLHSPVPTVLMEAMACGCAIVSTDTCMIPEIIEHGKNGLLSNDPNELRQFLLMLMNNEELAKKLGEEARKTMVEKFNLERFVQNWNDLLYDTVENYTYRTETLNENLS